jgi:hypothetical protein
MSGSMTSSRIRSGAFSHVRERLRAVAGLEDLVAANRSRVAMISMLSWLSSTTRIRPGSAAGHHCSLISTSACDAATAVHRRMHPESGICMSSASRGAGEVAPECRPGLAGRTAEKMYSAGNGRCASDGVA